MTKKRPCSEINVFKNLINIYNGKESHCTEANSETQKGKTRIILKDESQEGNVR
jgi:hypothetical protein